MALPRTADAPLPERYSRHAAPGFDQAALATPLVVISQRESDALADAVISRLTAMGVARVIVGSRSPMFRDVGALARAWRLSSDTLIDCVSIGLAREMTRALSRGEARAPYVLVDLTERPADVLAELASWPDTPRLYYVQRGSLVAIGHTPHETWAHMIARGARGFEMSGGQRVFAACHVAADYLAAIGAYRSPLDGPMPRARPLVSYDEPIADACVTGQTALFVGGGGALGHALLEAVLADRALRGALAGGRVVIVDPDDYDESNLSRQTLAGGVENIGRKKAVVTAEELERRWPGADRPRFVPEPQRYLAAMAAWYRPDVVALVADNFAARAAAFDDARERPGTLVLCAGTEFTYGQARAVVIGRSGTCLDHGPEQLWSSARAEQTAEARRTSCAREITPSNVLTNAIAGALLAAEWRRHASGWPVSRTQTLINWSASERAMLGPPLPACECWRDRGGAR